MPWTGAWAVSPQSDSASFNQQTIRQIVHTSIGGPVARVELSNAFGNRPLNVSDVHIAVNAGGSSIVAGTDHRVTFGGAAATTIPVGSSVRGDPVTMTVAALSNVVISAYLPQPTGSTACWPTERAMQAIANAVDLRIFPV